MATTFTLPLTQDKDAALKNINTSITEAGGEFNGDTGSGAFSGNTPMGMIKGSYVINNDEIEVTITKKPMLLSKFAIKAAIKEYLA